MKDSYLEKINRSIAEGPFRDDWDSLSSFEVPRWFRDSKFGVFVHWGVYTVPEHSNEWYSRNMYVRGMPEFDYHIRTYGPQDVFGYKDFIPLFTAERFDPDVWADLVRDSGARYYVQVAEHHDGFQMYESDLSEYNAKKMGPRRDVLGEMKRAVEKRGVLFGASSHRAEHWFFMSHGKAFQSDVKEPLKRGDFYWPAMPEKDHNDPFSRPYPSEEFLTDWLVRTCEIIDRYEPTLLYFDWWIQHRAFTPYLKKLAAYYYSFGARNRRPVAISYKHDAMMFGTGIPDVERGTFSETRPFPFQSDTAVARNSWCYTDSLDYKTAGELIRVLIDIVSKNGNLLLNIGPRADGSIAPEDRNILETIGKWLRINGCAVYNSKVWKTSEEGPTRPEEGMFSEKKTEYTSSDFRFTVTGEYINVFVLRCPEDGKLIIRSLSDSSGTMLSEFRGIISDVSVLGFEERPSFRRTGEGLVVNIRGVQSELPIVIRVRIE
ncbi:MAG: alpha-L-fucosidase [Clostridiaceae bacterium]|nr:alpha-L-fucosidase [Clostridiaceae bacterium]